MQFPEEDKSDTAHPIHPPAPAYSDADLEEMIDGLLKDMDKNLDGYVNYAEYKQYYWIMFGE